MSKHLATFNVFREKDGSLWVTCADASGVKSELHPDSKLTLHLMAMNALYEAVRQMQERGRNPSDPEKMTQEEWEETRKDLEAHFEGVEQRFWEFAKINQTKEG